MIELANVRGGQMIFNLSGVSPQKKPTPFGKYAWRKYAVSWVKEEAVSNITKRYVADPDPKILKVYMSSSMETDEVNELFTLVSPESWDLNMDGSGLSISINKYFMFGKPSGTLAFKSGSYSSQRPGVYFTSAEGAVVVPSDASYPVTKYSFNSVKVHTFEEYVVSDEEGEYPDKEELDGFYYEQIK